MTVLFRCDATTDIGFGHLSRCIALGEAFGSSKIDIVFVGRFDDAAIAQIAASGFGCAGFANSINEGDDERERLRDLISSEGIIIVDSYRTTPAYLRGLKSLGRPLVLLDDFATLEEFPCDVILNFTWGARSLGYPPGLKLLLGPNYFPARRRLVELRKGSITRDRSGPVSNLLIAVGGADLKRIAARLIRILRANHTDLCVRIIAANDDDLSDDLRDFGHGSGVLPRQRDLADQFLWADACISGGGLIKYESAFMGVPAAAISQNEGQAEETIAFSGAGLVHDLGLAESRTDEELEIAIDTFLADEIDRGNMIDKCREAFPADPSANAAAAILEAIGR